MLKDRMAGWTVLSISDTFNQKQGPGRGVSGREEEVLKGGVSYLGGFEVTSVGVERLSTSLCKRAFCSGIVDRYRPASWLEDGYS